MALVSFVDPSGRGDTPRTMALNVHVTGVSGLIGDVVYAHLAAQPDRYTVTGSGRRYESSSRVAQGRPLSCPPEMVSTGMAAFFRA